MKCIVNSRRCGSASPESTSKLTADVDIDLPLEAYLPEDYVPNLRHKIDLYRRSAKLEEASQIREIEEELKDRFGELPPPTQHDGIG